MVSRRPSEPAAALLLIATLATASSGPALADAGDAASPESEAITRAELNLRAGPGTEFAVVDLLPEGERVRVRGCIEDFRWCAVETEAGLGWAAAAYLQTRYFGRPFMVRDVGGRIGVPVVLYDPTVEGGAVGRDEPLDDLPASLPVAGNPTSEGTTGAVPEP